jgi:hypothetical protein
MAVTPNYSWPVPVATDFVKDGWEAISDLGNAIDTTVAGLGSPGLNLIQTQAISSVSSISLDDVFSADYNTYKIVLIIEAAVSSTSTILFRVRSGGTDLTTSTYTYARVRQRNNDTTYRPDGSTGSSSAPLMVTGLTSDIGASVSVDISNPFEIKRTSASWVGAGTESSPVTLTWESGAFKVLNNNSYDGFTIFNTNGANMTGSVSVWGYSK